MTVAGFTSTGSKHPAALFGRTDGPFASRMDAADGCTIHTEDGRSYLDLVMALGAVALGYHHPAVDAAVIDAVQRGSVGSLPPIDEERLATELAASMPWLEQVRFLKTGAEAVAAAVRIARTVTGRDLVLGCGYHGWLDWCSDAAGVPSPVMALYSTVPFNDCEATTARIRAAGGRLACVVIEPVVETAPSAEWLRILRDETERAGALLIFDEVKTAFRLAIGGVAERFGFQPDLMVLGKAMANGYPLGAVGGSARIMAAVTRTWISSTAATEIVSLAAARATLAVFRRQPVIEHLALTGGQLYQGLVQLAERHADRGVHATGIPQMCFLRFDDVATSERCAQACAARGLLIKRTAYNFVSLAHDAPSIDRALAIIDEVLGAC